MNRIITSTLAKYTVNVLMIFLFAGSAITGLFLFSWPCRALACSLK